MTKLFDLCTPATFCPLTSVAKTCRPLQKHGVKHVFLLIKSKTLHQMAKGQIDIDKAKYKMSKLFKTFSSKKAKSALICLFYNFRNQNCVFIALIQTRFLKKYFQAYNKINGLLNYCYCEISFKCYI